MAMEAEKYFLSLIKHQDLELFLLLPSLPPPNFFQVPQRSQDRASCQNKNNDLEDDKNKFSPDGWQDIFSPMFSSFLLVTGFSRGFYWLLSAKLRIFGLTFMNFRIQFQKFPINCSIIYVSSLLDHWIPTIVDLPREFTSDNYQSLPVLLSF